MTILKTILLFALLTPGTVGAGPGLGDDSLDLQTAIDYALKHNLELRAADEQISGAKGHAMEAGLLPNPEVYWRNETARTDGFFDQSEMLVGFSQALPLGGRTGAAARAGYLEVEAAGARRQQTELEVRARVHSLFVDALYYQQRLALQENIVASAQKNAELAAGRAARGDIIASEAAQAEMELIREQVRARNTRTLLQSALEALAVETGMQPGAFSRVAGDLEALVNLPDASELEAALINHPTLREKELEVQLARATEDRLRREVIPDIDIDVAYRRLHETDENSFDVGLSVTIPLFDRNQGLVAATRARERAAGHELRRAEALLLQRSREAMRRYGQQIAYVKVLQEELLPRAESVLKTAELRYEAGDINQLEVLTARRQAATCRLDYLEALRQTRLTAAQLELYLGSAP